MLSSASISFLDNSPFKYSLFILSSSKDKVMLSPTCKFTASTFDNSSPSYNEKSPSYTLSPLLVTVAITLTLSSINLWEMLSIEPFNPLLAK